MLLIGEEGFSEAEFFTTELHDIIVVEDCCLVEIEAFDFAGDNFNDGMDDGDINSEGSLDLNEV